MTKPTYMLDDFDCFCMRFAGFSFGLSSASTPSATGTSKKAKKQDRKKASTAASTVVQQLADNLHKNGWAACGKGGSSDFVLKCVVVAEIWEDDVYEHNPASPILSPP